jgi:uncharacterized protein (DUF1697 family)
MPMQSYVALLRGINVGGHNKVMMAELRALAAAIGLEEPRTLLQSGNLVFDAKPGSSASYEKLLEEAATDRLGVTVDFIVRSAREWSAIVTKNPFPAEAKSEPGRVVVMAFRTKLATAAVAELEDAIVGDERIHAIDRQLYIFYPDGMGQSRFTNTLIEKKLAGRGTARNWNTVLKIQALLNPS